MSKMQREPTVSKRYGLFGRYQRDKEGFTLPIEEAEYEGLIAGLDRYYAALAIEEAYDILSLNYIAFEEAVFTGALSGVISRRVSSAETDDFLRSIDRHLINFLASGEMFHQHAEKYITQLFRKNSDIIGRFEALRTKQQELLGYRAAPLLRNAFLHHGLPRSAWDADTTREDLDVPGSKRRYSFTISFEPEILRRDRKIAPEFIAELSAFAGGRRVSWTPICREYMQGLSALLAGIRGILRPFEQDAETLRLELFARFREFNTEQGLPICAGAESHEEGLEPQVILEPVWLEHFHLLRQRNRPLGALRDVQLQT